MVSLTGLLGSSQKKSFRRSMIANNDDSSTQIEIVGKIKRKPVNFLVLRRMSFVIIDFTLESRKQLRY
jgi:hypothetical protein